MPFFARSIVWHSVTQNVKNAIACYDPHASLNSVNPASVPDEALGAAGRAAEATPSIEFILAAITESLVTSPEKRFKAPLP